MKYSHFCSKTLVIALRSGNKVRIESAEGSQADLQGWQTIVLNISASGNKKDSGTNTEFLVAHRSKINIPLLRSSLSATSQFHRSSETLSQRK